jgi:type I restriction enzyme S subunit
LRDIAKIGTGATPLTSNQSYYANGIIPWITSAETSKDFIFKPTSFITQKALEETNCTVYPIGTLVIAMYGEGKTRGQISELQIESATNQACAAVSPILENAYNSRFIKACFKKNYEDLRIQAKGAQQPNLNLGIISDFVFPIPPLAEQQRIVAVVESAFTTIDEIEQNKSDLQSAVAAAKSKILSLAIRGKLVPQDPNDEPASVLLERIQAERETLIKAGKIKRSKGEIAAPVSVDNSYYENLPAGWIRAPIESLFSIVGGGTPSTNIAEYWGDGIPWFSSADIDENGNITPRRYVTQLGLDNSTTNVVPKGNVVVTTRVGLGKVAILDENMCFSQDNQALIPFYLEAIDNRYLFHFIFYKMQTLKHSGRGTTISGITKKQLADICLWVPPITEQCRIVKNIESVYGQLDKIAESLS